MLQSIQLMPKNTKYIFLKIFHYHLLTQGMNIFTIDKHSDFYYHISTIGNMGYDSLNKFSEADVVVPVSIAMI